MPAGKPFVRRGITFASQYAYRQFLATEKGFATPAARNKAIAAAKRVITPRRGQLTDAQVGVLSAGVADYKKRIGSYVEGAPIDKRGSNRLPAELQSLIRSLGDGQYSIWRMLY